MFRGGCIIIEDNLGFLKSFWTVALPFVAQVPFAVHMSSNSFLLRFIIEKLYEVCRTVHLYAIHILCRLIISLSVSLIVEPERIMQFPLDFVLNVLPVGYLLLKSDDLGTFRGIFNYNNTYLTSNEHFIKPY